MQLYPVVIGYAPPIILRRLSIAVAMAIKLESTVGIAVKHEHQLTEALIYGIRRCHMNDIKWNAKSHAKDLGDILIALTGIEPKFLVDILMTELKTFTKDDEYPSIAMDAVVRYLLSRPEAS